ncbi:glycosyltransferase [Protaetiibacter sp. SSC-01]|uniref:glycosyltransferase n=1 Tax=Protaetiibacter sp. SSC-01 TaxID=2759943 RepID=UPI00223BBB58|nr:glycosyltransferase [Protaetiibacter sp. SSC-01]
MTDAPSSTPPTEARLTILIGCDTFAPDVNGAATFSRNLAAGLASRGHDVHVMAPAQKGAAGTFTEVHEGVPMTVHRVYSWRWLPHPWLRFMLPWRVKANAERIVREVKPDAIHFQSHIVVGRGLATSAKRHGIRLVGTNHTMPENILQHVEVLPKATLDWLARIQWRAARKWFEMAEAITAPTRRAADFFERGTGLTGVHAISCGIDMSFYTPDFSPREENIVAFLGRLDEEKYIHEAIEAVAKLQDLDAKLVIIGDGEMRPRLEARARELGVTDRVRFTGRVSDDELRRELTGASVFAMPSRAELQSIATMEALASGLPVVAADAMALPHLVHPGLNGYLYQPGDVDEFARHLRAVLTATPEELDRLRRGALRTVEPHDIQRTLDIFEALYRGETVVDPDTEGELTR